jgi:hypothetical protein
MNKNLQNGMQCSQFEALLAEALDQSDERGAHVGVGALSAETGKVFEAHRLSCSVCAPLYAEAREGMLLLRAMEVVEPPRNLVHNILAATSRAEAGASSAAAVQRRGQAGWVERLHQSLRPTLAVVLHSRFVTSFCMAFFSLSLTMSLAGVKVTELTKVDWHPSALRRSVVLEYTQIEARVMRYYDNMRLVYEVQSQVQKLKKAATPAQNDNKDNNQPEQQNRNPRPEQEENYSQERDGSLMAQSTTNYEGAQL